MRRLEFVSLEGDREIEGTSRRFISERDFPGRGRDAVKAMRSNSEQDLSDLTDEIEGYYQEA